MGMAPSIKRSSPKDEETGDQIIILDPSSKDSWKVPKPTSTKASKFVVLPVDSKTDSLTVFDNRSQKLYNIPIEMGTVKATAFKKIVGSNAEGIRIYDPGYLNTAVTRSKITDIDGEKGILRYRGYPIEELAEKSSFLEVAFLLLYGELPTKVQFHEFHHEVMHHTFLHIKLTELMKTFNYDAHPMGMFIASIAAMSTFDPSCNPSLAGNDIYKLDKGLRNKQIFRLLGKVTTVAAMAYRHRIGRPYNFPRSDMSYTENFLYMLDHLSEENYRPHPKLARALDVLFILHADHELNCSTAAMRHISSSLVDPYSAVAGAAAALYGPLHGGANEAVVRMLEEIRTVDRVPQFLEKVQRKEKKLMGFGHRIYRNHDPRAKIIRQIAFEVFEVVGKDPLIDVAMELERQALNNPYFIERKLYPNIDFYSGIIYKSMGFPLDFFPVLFAIPRVAGWLAHWSEGLDDPDAKIWRPRQIYVGHGRRNYLPIEHRSEVGPNVAIPTKHPFNRRSAVAEWERKPLSKL